MQHQTRRSLRAAREVRTPGPRRRDVPETHFPCFPDDLASSTSAPATRPVVTLGCLTEERPAQGSTGADDGRGSTQGEPERSGE